MRRDLALQFSRVTEAAALAGYKWLGRGDKNIADGAAVEAMRHMLNQSDIDGEIVIGEGEIDDAPMLFIGEKLGCGEEEVDIAVDPIEGTRMTAMGQANAVAVLAAGERGCFLKAPDMYMEKLVVGPKAKGHIDLTLTLEENLRNVAKVLNKPLDQLTVVTLAKPRHDQSIKDIQALGCRVFALPDGDVAASILCSMPISEVDLMYCVGGAPEGVISAAVTRALGGDMQGKLVLRNKAKGHSAENDAAAEMELSRCQQMGVEVDRVYKLEELVRSDNLVFSATGITKGDLLEGVRRDGDVAVTETLLVRGKSRTVRKIESIHYVERKDDEIKRIIL